MPKEVFLRTKEAAHVFSHAIGEDVSPDDLLDYARAGRLKAEKIGRYWQFKQKDIVDFCKKVLSDRDKAKRARENERRKIGTGSSSNAI